MLGIPLGLAAFVVTVGLADALNPSTVAPAIALAIDDDGAGRAAAFTAGVAAVSTLVGLVLVAGPGEAIIALIPHPGSQAKHIGEIVLGVLLLALAVAAWVGRRRLARSLSGGGEKRRRGSGTAFALGAGIMGVELPTAFPYFAAVLAIIGSNASLAGRIGLVLLYNVAFVIPLLGIVVVRIVAGDAATARLLRFRDWLASHAGAILTVLLAAGGTALLIAGIVGL